MISANSLYSSHWYRVGHLRPRLQHGVSLQKQMTRSEVWFVATHPLNGRHFRLNRKSYELVARLNGEISVDALWNGLQEKLGDDAPTQDETIGLLAQLMESGLILFDTLPNWPALQEVNDRRIQEQNLALNPFAFKIKLFDPSALLDRLRPLSRILFQPFILFLWIALIAWGCMRAALDWDSIQAYAAVHLLTPQYLLLAWFIYPFLKALHELGHGLAVRHWGGEVRETGVSFFLLMPAPYVDASDATVFSDKWQRITVGAAGIAVELALAVLALLFWQATETGLLRDIAFVIMAIGGLSTVVFNANPLLRFDGYYILCDLFELPNLASRSKRLWSSFIQRYVLGIQGERLTSTRGEYLWLLIYNPASVIYRISISIIIVKWIIAKSILLGFLAMLWLIVSLILQPVWKIISDLSVPSHPSEKRWIPLLRATGAMAALLAIFIWVPVPSSTVASGLVWMPEQAQVRSKTTGQVAEILVQDGATVVKGDALIVMSDPTLNAEKKRLMAKIRAQETEQIGNMLTESVRSRNAAFQLNRLQTDDQVINEKLKELTLRAEVDGVFVLPHREDLHGRYVQKGTLLGYVIGNNDVTVRAVVSHDDEGRIKEGVKSVSVWLAEDRKNAFSAHLIREIPAATHQLPSAALGDRIGGEFITDPADRDGLKTLEPIFLIDVGLSKQKLERLGGRAWIRFEHEATPLANRMVWQLRQLFIKLFRAES